ncbi:hypothetical protein Tco_0761523 [Tanacetum coccineum]
MLFVETLENPFVAPVNIETIEDFMNMVGYQGVIDKVSAFYMKNLAQPWQAMFKVFNRCLTTRTSGHDETKINILQMFHAVINQTNVDYAALLWWDFTSNVNQKKESIQYPRFIKLIITDLIKKFPDIPQRIEDDYHSIKDDIPLVMVKGEKDGDDSVDRLEPVIHKDNPKHVDDDDDKDKEKVDEEEGGEIEVTDLVSQEFNAQAPKIIEELFKNYVQSNMKRSLQDQANDLALWEVLKCKFEKSSTSYTSCRDDDIHSQRHDDHQEDDAPPEGEKRVKRHKTSKSLKSVRGSMSKHSAKYSTTYVSKQQQQQEWDAWVEETVIDEDEVILEDETPKLITKLQDVDKRVPTIYDYARMKATLNDALSNQFKNAQEYAYHLEQTKNFLENQIVWESRQEDIRRPVLRPLVFFRPQRNPNEPPRYLYNKDLFFLKYGNTEEKKYILSLHKIHRERFPKVDLEEKMNHWVRKEFKNFNEEARLERFMA